MSSSLQDHGCLLSFLQRVGDRRPKAPKGSSEPWPKSGFVVSFQANWNQLDLAVPPKHTLNFGIWPDALPAITVKPDGGILEDHFPFKGTGAHPVTLHVKRVGEYLAIQILLLSLPVASICFRLCFNFLSLREICFMFCRKRKRKWRELASDSVPTDVCVGFVDSTPRRPWGTRASPRCRRAPSCSGRCRPASARRGANAARGS